MKGKQVKEVDGKEIDTRITYRINLDQTEGIKTPEIDQQIRTDAEKIEQCEKIVNVCKKAHVFLRS